MLVLSRLAEAPPECALAYALGALQEVEPASGPGGLAWIDWIGLGLIALFLLLGWVRGLWWQLIRLAGLVLAVAVARACSPMLEPTVIEALPDLSPRVVYGIVWISLFLLALALAAFLGHLGQKLLKAMQLDAVDRFGGGAVGAATGLLIHVALLAGLAQLAPAGWLQGVLADTHSEELLLAVGRRWPIVVTGASGAEVESALRAAPARPVVR